MLKTENKGFTLIELLIVVAIIAILAAIAIPNFLQAQTRAKVAHVLNNLRQIGTAMEAFRLDNQHYPPHFSLAWGDCFADPMDPLWSMGWLPSLNASSEKKFAMATLTTPIAYVPGYIPDIFNANPRVRWVEPRFGTISPIWGRWQYGIDIGATKAWVFESVGPDRNENPYSSPPTAGCYPFRTSFTALLDNQGLSLPEIRQMFIEGSYDPTNGTISNGDIFRMSE